MTRSGWGPQLGSNSHQGNACTGVSSKPSEARRGRERVPWGLRRKQPWSWHPASRTGRQISTFGPPSLGYIATSPRKPAPRPSPLATSLGLRPHLPLFLPATSHVPTSSRTRLRPSCANAPLHSSLSRGCWHFGQGSFMLSWLAHRGVSLSPGTHTPPGCPGAWKEASAPHQSLTQGPTIYCSWLQSAQLTSAPSSVKWE